MAATVLHFRTSSSFDQAEQETLRALHQALDRSPHPDRGQMQERLAEAVDRVDVLAEALAHYPSVYSETALGGRRRDISTLVDHLAGATDATLEFLLPTRALVGRTLVMAELNAWRLFSYICDEGISGDGETHGRLQAEIGRWLHSCIYIKLTEEVLCSISQDADMERPIRARAVEALAVLWENRRTYRVRDFFPLLEATWVARRRIRVSVGTMLGISEIFRLIQAGCDEGFVDYFARSRLTSDERDAFQEFLIGVPTEKITSLEQLLRAEGRTSLSPEEAAEALARDPRKERRRRTSGAVAAYEFFRARYLEAAARRLKGLPGPKRTAEEYVMIYFLDQQAGQRAGC